MKTRHPDFYIASPTGRRLVVEVKQFDSNRDEILANQAVAERRAVVTRALPGSRLRAAIKTAGPQLRAKCRGKWPGMLVVYNDVRSWKQHTDPHAVMTAMRGRDLVELDLPRDLATRPQFICRRPGPKKA